MQAIIGQIRFSQLNWQLILKRLNIRRCMQKEKQKNKILSNSLAFFQKLLRGSFYRIFLIPSWNTWLEEAGLSVWAEAELWDRDEVVCLFKSYLFTENQR